MLKIRRTILHDAHNLQRLVDFGSNLQLRVDLDGDWRPGRHL